MHDLDELLARREALREVGADRSFLDAIDEGTRDAHVHVGFEEGPPDLASDLVDVLLRQPPPVADAAEDAFETVGQRVEQGAG